MDGFERNWHATILSGPPMIAPAKSYVFPRAVPGEEDALARGALWLDVKPEEAPNFLVQCALGFAGKGVATGVWATPKAGQMLAVAGGYAYRIETQSPESTELLPMRPVVGVYASPEAGALALVGFHNVLVMTTEDMWQSEKLTWEGLTEIVVDGVLLRGKGWHMPSDKELPFSLNLKTRELSGGAFELRVS